MPGKSLRLNLSLGLPELGSWLAGEQLPSCVADIQGSTSAYKFVVTPKRAFSFWGLTGRRRRASSMEIPQWLV